MDNTGNRIKPIKRATGNCQICKKRVRAYCGEINIHHWRHIDLSQCDFWKENETEWHRKWKEKFPIEWQEIVIKDDEQIHRADVKTASGLVVEFQNSSISTSDVKKRERFYGNMVWLINAEEFKSNFRLWSLVKSQLRQHDDMSYNYYQGHFQKADSEEVRTQKQLIEETNGKLSQNKYQRIVREGIIRDLIEVKGNIGEQINTYLSGKYGFYGIMKNFKSEMKVMYIENINKLNAQVESLNSKTELYNRLTTFDKCNLSGYENYSIVDPNLIHERNFGISRLVEKESIESFFPQVITFKSEQEFRRISRNDKYIFIIDFSSKIESLQSEIKDLNKEILIINNSQDEILKDMKIEIQDFVEFAIEEANSELNALSQINLDLQNEWFHYNKELSNIEIQEEIEENLRNKELAQVDKKRRFEIMKDYKGLYGYHWKYKRKTWDYSNQPLYLDFGNEIFHIQDGSTLRKISCQDFVDMVVNY